VEMFPENSFRAIQTKDRLISFDTLTFAMFPKRSRMYFLTFDFLANWFSFYTSLMLFKNGSATDGATITLGVISIVTLSFVVHSLFSAYLSKYRIRFVLCRCILGITYCTVLIGFLTFLSSGFIIAIEIGQFTIRRNGTISGSIPNAIPLENAGGFYTGLVLSIVFIVAFLQLATCFLCLSACGFVVFRGRKTLIASKQQPQTPQEEEEEREAIPEGIIIDWEDVVDLIGAEDRANGSFVQSYVEEPLERQVSNVQDVPLAEVWNESQAEQTRRASTQRGLENSRRAQPKMKWNILWLCCCWCK
jgi:hypothetical protein